ncbi:MAG TPA: hypothetical protein VGY56_17440 [Verrucomicrobiae bacterium]|nr:hypothetical protein [Verrucomicrobiae bacterium]
MEIAIPDLKDIKDIKAVRAFYEQQRQALCSMADNLEEPLKGHFNNLKKKYDDVLDSLPPTEQVPAALEAGKHLSALYSILSAANGLMCSLNSALNGVKTTGAALNSEAISKAVQDKIAVGELFPKSVLDSKVAAEVERLTKSGDYVPKATVQQLCSEAKSAGIAEGENKIRQEASASAEKTRLVEARKAQVQTAGLPLPESEIEKILSGSETDFAATLKKAQDRFTGLKKHSALNSKSPLMAKIWLGESEFTTFEQLLKDTIGEPLASGHQANVGPMIV